MAKTYKFEELSTKAKLKAMTDYVKGWEETHEDDEMTIAEVISCCKDDDADYTKTGRYAADNY